MFTKMYGTLTAFEVPQLQDFWRSNEIHKFILIYIPLTMIMIRANIIDCHYQHL